MLLARVPHLKVFRRLDHENPARGGECDAILWPENTHSVEVSLTVVLNLARSAAGWSFDPPAHASKSGVFRPVRPLRLVYDTAALPQRRMEVRLGSLPKNAIDTFCVGVCCAVSRMACPVLFHRCERAAGCAVGVIEHALV